MQLFSRQEANKDFTQKQGVDIARVAYLTSTLKKLQDRINIENAEFEKNMANQRKVYSDEKVALQGQIRALEATLEGLRAERAGLMIPITDLKREAEELAKEANRRLIEIDDKEIEIQDLYERATIKLNGLTDKEKKLDEWELSLKVRQMGIEAESEQVALGHKRLNDQMKDFFSLVEKKTQEITDKEKTLEIERLRSKEYLDLRIKEIEDEKKGLADRRAAFEREYARLNNNKK